MKKTTIDPKVLEMAKKRKDTAQRTALSNQVCYQNSGVKFYDMCNCAEAKGDLDRF